MSKRPDGADYDKFEDFELAVGNYALYASKLKRKPVDDRIAELLAEIACEVFNGFDESKLKALAKIAGDELNERARGDS